MEAGDASDGNGISAVRGIRTVPPTKIAAACATLLLGLVVPMGCATGRSKICGRPTSAIRQQKPISPCRIRARQIRRFPPIGLGCRASAAGPAVVEAQPIGDRSRWLTPIDYPLLSLQADEKGLTVLAMTIDTMGRLTECAVVGASGHLRLDQDACAILSERARFEPARDAAECLVPTSDRQRVRWQIPPG